MGLSPWQMNKLETEIFHAFYLNIDFPLFNLRKNYDPQGQKILKKKITFTTLTSLTPNNEK